MMERVGFIGVGDMGGPMAANLIKAGFAVVVHDLQPDRLENAAKTGAEAARDARDVANRAEIVFACLNTIPAMHAVAAAVARGEAIRVFVDLSTTGPTHALACREHFKETAIEMLDAPVSGFISRAVDGTLAVMASGPSVAFERVRPAFEAIGSHIFYFGDLPGGGQMMKLVNNYINNVQTIATSEAVCMGQRFGLDTETMFDVLNVSTGRNSQTDGQLRLALREGGFQRGAMMPVSLKDISLALEEAGRLGCFAATGETAREILSEAVGNGGDKERSSAIFRHIAAKPGHDC